LTYPSSAGPSALSITAWHPPMRHISAATRGLSRRISVRYQGGPVRGQARNCCVASSSTPRQPVISGRTLTEWLGAPRLS